MLETEAEQTAHEHLTERWDSDIILTNLVQFLNACHAAPNSAARRMHRLTNAVLIFDEIQSLPKHCKVLFERAIRFLTAYGHSTVLLCTATQPRLSLSPAPTELIPDVDALYAQLKRVHYFPQLDARRTYASAGAEIARMLAEQSALVILNVKAAAWQVYRAAVEALQSRGVQLNQAEETSCPDGQILCVHLSTRLCPAHRKRLIARVKRWLQAGRRVLCVSTALIEAGINVSFPVVIRDLAGLPSIVQAAGRANRSMEYGDGRVLIWDFPEETGALSYLPDVQNSGNITRAFLHDAEICPEGLDSPMLLNKYFLREEAYIKETQKFPVQVQEGGRTERRFLVHWLALNNAYARMAQENARANQLVLHQSFRTAAQHFFVIADDRIPVLVPWGEGKRIIAALGEARGMQEKIRLIRRAQAYTVQVEERVYQQLAQRNAVVQLGDSGVLALKEGYYSEEAGILLASACEKKRR